jgi:hypothetical protein
VPRGDLPHVAVEGAVRREAEVQRLKHALFVPGRGEPRGEEGLGLRGEQQLAVPKGVEERLHPETIPRGEQALSPCVPQHHGELAAKEAHRLGAQLLVQVNGHLAVAARAQAVATRREGFAEPVGVVQLAVDDADHTAILVRDGLGAAREVDDGEPHVPEHGGPVGRTKDPLAVRTPMAQGGEGGGHPLGGDGTGRDDDDEATHGDRDPLRGTTEGRAALWQYNERERV